MSFIRQLENTFLISIKQIAVSPQYLSVFADIQTPEITLLPWTQDTFLLNVFIFNFRAPFQMSQAIFFNNLRTV